MPGDALGVVLGERPEARQIHPSATAGADQRQPARLLHAAYGGVGHAERARRLVQRDEDRPVCSILNHVVQRRPGPAAFVSTQELRVTADRPPIPWLGAGVGLMAPRA